MAGFVGKFADESGISLLYGYKLNGDRKKNLTRGSKKFSRHASEELSSAPEELREDIVSSDKLMRRTFPLCRAENFSNNTCFGGILSRTRKVSHGTQNFSCNVW